MEAYYSDDDVQLYLGDVLDVLPNLPAASVDAIVCDPPYEITFMGRAWDSSGIAYNVDVWRECLRVLKPGGHLVAFGGTRTYHRMACAIEDAGFEIRDSLHWLYGSGFPKGQNIAKAIDKRRDDRCDVLRVTAWLAEAFHTAGWSTTRVDSLWGFNGMAGHWTTQGKAASVPTPDQWDRLRDALGFDDAEIRPLVATLNGRRGALGEAWSSAEVTGEHPGDTPGFPGHRFETRDRLVRAANSDAARRWQGWNTALKPAHEPIILARKSTGFNTTVANVLEHGTGALNIDACRIAAGQDYRAKCASVVGLDSNRNGDAYSEWTGAREDSAHAAGRWPTNVVLSHAPLLGEHGQPVGDACAGGCVPGCPGAELGGASRFFPVFRYEAKAPASERPRLPDGTAWPTVKPLALMRWLVRLVTPPGGVVLDPFCGTGTTLEAAVTEGFHAIGIDADATACALTVTRLAKPIATALPGLDP